MFWIAIFVAIVTSVIGDFFVEQGSTEVRSSSGNIVLKIFRRPKTLFGVSLLTIHFAALSLAFREAPVTMVVPLMAMTYIANTIIARTILHEEVNQLRWIGVLVVAVGVMIVGIGS
jgi:drug/metabolite transporter (DMT)-like permease